MNRKNSPYGTMERAKSYTGIILRLQKSHSRQLQLTIYTKEAGILYVYVPKGKKGYAQGFGSLLAFTQLTFDAWERNHVLFMGEYESRRSSLLDDLTWESYVYTQIFVEMVLQLTPTGEKDEQLYALIGAYSTAIGSRNVRVATIIAGWQLTACAGYLPDTEETLVYRRPGVDGSPVYYLSDECLIADGEVVPPLKLPEELRQLWQTFLTYSWKTAAPLRLSKRYLDFLEQLLYSYVEEISGRPLKSRAALQSVDSDRAD